MTSLTTSDVAKILASPVQGLKLLFLGGGKSEVGAESKGKKPRGAGSKVMTRADSISHAGRSGYPSAGYHDRAILNPADSEKVPLRQEEGKVSPQDKLALGDEFSGAYGVAGEKDPEMAASSPLMARGGGRRMRTR